MTPPTSIASATAQGKRSHMPRQKNASKGRSKGLKHPRPVLRRAIDPCVFFSLRCSVPRRAPPALPLVPFPAGEAPSHPTRRCWAGLLATSPTACPRCPLGVGSQNAALLHTRRTSHLVLGSAAAPMPSLMTAAATQERAESIQKMRRRLGIYLYLGSQRSVVRS